MLEFDFRGRDPHHHYHVRARDAPQADRIKTYILSRIAAGDPYLRRAPAIEGARISTQRRPSRPQQISADRRSAVPPRAPSAQSGGRYRSLASEGGKRGVVDTVGLLTDAVSYPIWGRAPAMLVGALFPKERAATGALEPTLSDYVQRAAARLGVVHPEMEAHNFGERLALDGTRFAVGSAIPGAFAKGAIGGTRAAATVFAGAGSSVIGGDTAEHLGVPRWVGEVAAPLALGGGVGVASRARNIGGSKLFGGRSEAFHPQGAPDPGTATPKPALGSTKLETVPHSGAPSTDATLSFGRDRHNAGLVLRDGVPLATPDGRVYTVMYRTFLDPATTPRRRSTQSRRVAKEMHDLASANPEWGQLWEDLSPGVLHRLSVEGGRQLPEHWVAHHPPARPNVIHDPAPLGTVEVTPKWMHMSGEFRRVYHGENNRGGFADLPDDPPRRR